MSLLKSLALLILALVASVTAASLTWDSFISYDNEFIDPDFWLSRPWEKDNTTLDAVQSVVSWADAVSLQGPWSVTQKPFSWSGDKHTYESYAPYWWPDCSKVGNKTELTQEQISKTCPYVVRDGQFVPDVRSINDTGAYAATCDATFFTALAWVITNDTKYADRSIEYIRTWFIDQDTYMEPNLNFSQVVRGPPGTQQGSHYGVLDLKTTSKILTAILLFRKTNYPGWTKQYDDAMIKWSDDFVHWLETHPFGKQEMETPNNHGSFSFGTMAAFQLIANHKDEALRYLKIYFDGIYMNQIDATGEQPFEVLRSRTYHYRAYNAAALMNNCKLAQFVGYDGWSKPTKNGTVLKDAVDWAMKFDPSITNEVKSAPAAELYYVVGGVAAHYGDPDGKYAAYLAGVQPTYPQSPYFAWDQPLALPAGYKVSGSISSVANSTKGSNTGSQNSENAAVSTSIPTQLLFGAAIVVSQLMFQFW